MPAESFADVLVRASKAAGSLLELAVLLGVEPRQVYCWIAEVERPTEEARRQLEGRLCALTPGTAGK